MNMIFLMYDIVSTYIYLYRTITASATTIASNPTSVYLQPFLTVSTSKTNNSESTDSFNSIQSFVFTIIYKYIG